MSAFKIKWIFRGLILIIIFSTIGIMANFYGQF